MATQREGDSFWLAMAKSYANQNGGVTIPAADIDKVCRIPLGFQPFGISAHPLAGGEGDEVLIAAYFEPAVCLAHVYLDGRGLDFDVDWIRGADVAEPGNQPPRKVRIFPDVAMPSMANRMQTAVFPPMQAGSPGDIWVSRNGERRFYRLRPPSELKGRWQVSLAVDLPADATYDTLHSACIRDDRLHTVESDGPMDRWCLRIYETIPASGRQCRFTLVNTLPIGNWTYGLPVQDGALWTITDERSSRPHGIYADGENRVPGITGTGLCFLSDGSALVAYYGQAAPGCFNGRPGELVYVPARFLRR